MKVEMVTLFPQSVGNVRRSAARIHVPGLGGVEIVGCLSEETMQHIQDECIAALRIKLGSGGKSGVANHDLHAMQFLQDNKSQSA